MTGRTARVLLTACVVSSLVFAGLGWTSSVQADLKQGTPDLKSAGPLAFAPGGVLLVGDSQNAAVFAIETGDKTGGPKPVNIENLGNKVADMLGVTTRQMRINDLAVNPSSGNIYLSVSRGRGSESTPVVLKVSAAGKISEFSLKDVKFAKAELPNAPAAGERPDRRGRTRRGQSITDLAFVDGKVYVAGLSNEEFASTLRAIPYPFQDVNRGAGIEIYHGAHGKFETNSPVRTFTSYKIDGQQNLLCAYTCTPLVKIPVGQLKAGSKVKGVTVAELGNRNNPLDMFVYTKDGKDYLLVANTSRGVMKITTEGLSKAEGITERIRGKAGLTYDTIEDLQGIVQLDRLDNEFAVVLAQTEGGQLNLNTVPLP